MATPGLLGIVNQLRAETANGFMALKSVRSFFPDLHHETFWGLWKTAGLRQTYSARISSLNFGSRPTAERTLMPSEFKVPFNYRYTFQHTMINTETGEKRSFFSSMYDDRLLTRGEAQEIGHMNATTMQYSGEYKQIPTDPNWVMSQTRLTLAEQNTLGG